MLPSNRTSAVRAFTLIAVLGLAACAHRTGPSTGNTPLRPGAYSFSGSVIGENRYGNQVRTFHEPFSGIVRIRTDGSVELSSTHGSCGDGRMNRGTAFVSCGSIAVRLTPTSATVSLVVDEQEEVRTNRCAATYPAASRSGRPQCVQYETEIRTVRRARSSRVQVIREG